MKRTTFISKARALVSSLALFLLSALSLSAQQFGLFSYSVTNENTVIITDYPEGATGEVVILAEIDGKPVTEIGEQAFRGCSGLTSVTIPDSVTEIGGLAFFYCRGLTSVTIGNSVTRMGEWAFSGCNALTSVIIPDSVTEIGNRAFSGCSGLTSVTIPDSVTWIGERAFSGCSGLTSVTIPDSVTSIGPGAFRGCSALTAMTIPDSVTEIGSWAFDGCSGLVSVTIPDSVTEIGSYAFQGCSSLTSVMIPDSVTEIGDNAFLDCSGLTAVTIGNSVTVIGSRAFEGCSGLVSVTIPDSVTAIGSWAFWECSSLTSIEVVASNLHFSSVEGVLFNTERTTLIQFPAGRSGAYVIPDSVTEIGRSAFFGCSGLSSVTIPDSVTEIGSWAFLECSSLTSIEVVAGNLHFSSVEGVLFNTEQTTLIRFPIGRSGAYVIPDSVTSIGPGAFQGCSSLTSIEVVAGSLHFSSVEGVLFNTEQTTLIRFPTGRSGAYVIPDSVTEIGERAFRGCSGLSSVTIPDSVTEIGSSAFIGSGLTSVTIPDSVTSIGEWAFSGSALTSVTIGDSVTWIGKWAFGDCNGLSSVLFLGGNPPHIEFVSFGGLSSGFSGGPDNRIFFYLSGSTGFRPTLEGSPTVMLDRASGFTVPSWLLAQDLPHDTDLSQDLNGDGVNLLTAYALDLDPSMNLAPQMPRPELGEGTMTMSFHGDAQGIRYTVETSTDLENWTSDGVTLSDPNEDGMRSATVDRGSLRRFLRLVVDRE